MPARKTEFDSKLIGEIAEIMAETGLTEVELRQGESQLRLSKAGTAAPAPTVVATSPLSTPAPAPAPAPPPTEQSPEAAQSTESLAEHPGTVTSPMVGTIYLAPQPDADPFVNVGDRIAEGDTLMIIEAMKVMNPLPSPRGGTIKAILVTNAQPVEFGDPLIIVE